MRRTFISLARTEGARADLLERVTHNTQKKGRSIDVYSTFEWEPLCREVAKLKVSRRTGAEALVSLPRAAGAEDEHED